MDLSPAPAPRADVVDRLALDVLAEEAGAVTGADALVVLDDATGALSRWAQERAAEQGREQSGCRAVLSAVSLQSQQPLPTGPGLAHAGVQGPLAADFGDAARPERLLVLLRLPRSLAALRARGAEVARLARELGAADVIVVAAGRSKHMTRSQNDVLGEVFADVHATRGRGQARALVARGLGESEPSQQVLRPHRTVTIPVRGREQEVTLVGSGGVFAGASADAGGLLLLRTLDTHLTAHPEEAAQIRHAVDLGSGNGLLSVHLALALEQARIRASDDDRDAVAATRASLEASGCLNPQSPAPQSPAAGESEPRIAVHWETSLAEAEHASADLLVLNPPFHEGTAIDATLAQGLLDAAARVLRPGGELWFVHNSHLRYRTEVERRVGSVQQAARDRRFTVLRATRH